MKKSFVGIMGIIFIVMGIIGAFGILLSFEWGEWSRMADYVSLEEDRAISSERLNSTVVIASVALIGNLAIGSVLLALDKIIGLLQSNKQEVDKSE